MLDAIVFYLILKRAPACAGYERCDHNRFLRLGKDRVFGATAWKIHWGEKCGSQQTIQQRQRMLDAINIYCILHANSVAVTRFLNSKRTSGSENQPTTIQSTPE